MTDIDGWDPEPPTRTAMKAVASDVIKGAIRDKVLIDFAEELDQARAKIKAVRDLHHRGGVIIPNAGYPQGWCEHDSHAWPCATIRRLDA